MDTNLAAWMIAGGPRIELHATQRDREQLHAFRESRESQRVDRPSLIARIRHLVDAKPATAELHCCPA